MWLFELSMLEDEYVLFKEEKERMFSCSKDIPKKKILKKKVKKVLDIELDLP